MKQNKNTEIMTKLELVVETAKAKRFLEDKYKDVPEKSKAKMLKILLDYREFLYQDEIEFLKTEI